MLLAGVNDLSSRLKQGDSYDVHFMDHPENRQLLMKQAYIRDPSITVQDLVNETVGKLGENIRVRRFTRFALGE